MAETQRSILLSSGHIEYLRRGGALSADSPPRGALTTAPPDFRRLCHIRGIGRGEKKLDRDASLPVRLPSEDVLIGLHGYRIPLAFVVEAKADGVAIHLGVWSPAVREGAPAQVLDDRQRILTTLLASLNTSVDLAPSSDAPAAFPLAGFALGVPMAKRSDAPESAMPLDRVIQAMRGSRWACLVLAEPVDDQFCADRIDQVLAELRVTEASAEATMAPSPLANHYAELLGTLLATLSHGQAVGAWRTAAYLLGDEESYHRLASVWRGVFSGEQSIPEPVRVQDDESVAELARQWAMMDGEGSPGPGRYRHPFRHQTLLNSAQLAAYVHLPNLETTGFAIRLVPDFDAVPPPAGDGPGLRLGEVIHRSHATGSVYAVGLSILTRHAFIAGVTGSGKTNTVFNLLHQANAAGVPFLVLEPAKTEYRALAVDPEMRGRVRVFTPGNENVSPLRLNPFEVLPGTSVGVHIDLLRSVFGASFGMWTPLPQVLEECLHRVYEDLGWDIATGVNYRVDENSVSVMAFPTLTDLLHKVDEITPQLGYDERVTNDIRAALRTRINGLRTGGKGSMLDTQRSLPMDVLLEQPGILELEGLGDDDDKAFVMALLLVRLAEHRRATSQSAASSGELRHLLVIEEAHRLLTRVESVRGEGQADSRGKAVETFAHLLSEIRAYGQGVIIADQVPVRLAPDVVKNTNLKIVHRVVSEEDRRTLAGAMAMTESQTTALATLRLGEAAVFAEGDDSPLLIRVPRYRDGVGAQRPDDRTIVAHMAVSETAPAHGALVSPLTGCSEALLATGRVRVIARQIAEEPQFRRAFTRTILSTLEDSDALDRMWPDLMSVVRSRRPPTVEEEELLRSLWVRAADWYAQKRGAQTGWSFSQTEELANRLQRMLLAKLEEGEQLEVRNAFRQFAMALHRRTYSPYPACDAVCRQEPKVCLYRYAAADLVAVGTHREAWRKADRNDALSAEGGRQRTWEVCQDAGYDLIEWPESEAEWAEATRLRVSAAARRTALCYGQQILADDEHKQPRTVRRIMARLLKEAKA